MESSVRRMLGDIKEFACREPAKAGAAVFAVGLLINLMPTRAVVGTVTALSSVLMRPALLSLGIYKAAELCCPNLKNLPPSGTLPLNIL